jgi:hypothetical protein
MVDRCGATTAVTATTKTKLMRRRTTTTTPVTTTVTIAVLVLLFFEINLKIRCTLRKEYFVETLILRLRHSD